MLDMTGGPTLEAEHTALKRETRALALAHERLRLHGGTNAERKAHLARLRDKIAELEMHFQRLRQRAEEQCANRERAYGQRSVGHP